MSELICVKTFANRTEAELARGILAASGVRAIVLADDAGGTHPELPYTRGVRLLVESSLAARALELLR